MLNGWLLGNEEKENEVHYHIIVRYIGLVCSAVCWRVEWSVEAKVGERNVLYCGRFSGCLIHAFGKLSTFGRCFCFMTNLDNAAGCAVSGQDYTFILKTNKTGDSRWRISVHKSDQIDVSPQICELCCVWRDWLGLSIACVEKSSCVPVWLIRSTKARE